jgi:hypothetical protein
LGQAEGTDKGHQSRAIEKFYLAHVYQKSIVSRGLDSFCDFGLKFADIGGGDIARWFKSCQLPVNCSNLHGFFLF